MTSSAKAIASAACCGVTTWAASYTSMLRIVRIWLSSAGRDEKTAGRLG